MAEPNGSKPAAKSRAAKAPQIYALLPKVMESISVIGKEQTNTFDKYQFRGIDDVYNAVQPALVKHSVVVVPTVLDTQISERKTDKGKSQTRATLTVQYSFYAPDGSSIEAVVVGQAEDRSDKACNKAMTAAFKYALFQTFCIPTEGDNDADSKTPQSEPATTTPEPPVKRDVNMDHLRGDAGTTFLQSCNDADDALVKIAMTAAVTTEAHAYVTEFPDYRGAPE